jgi:catechol 2,3-dioxygenase-like lactoylglutathione lyase family enzyme
MKLQKIYTALLTADLAAAERWYTKVLGRGPDNRPMDTLVQWEPSTKVGWRFQATTKSPAGA